MSEKIYYDGYDRPMQLEKDINILTTLIDNAQNDNIINKSKVNFIKQNIKRIEKNIRITKLRNIINPCIKNIKIFGRLLKKVYPYIICASLLFGAQSIIADVPFYRQDVSKFAYYEKIIDDTGIITNDKTYRRLNPNFVDSAEYISNWKKKDDENYYRIVIDCNFDDLIIEELKEYADNPRIDPNKIFDNSTTIEYQVKSENEILEDELNSQSQYKVIYAYVDKEDNIIEAQDTDENIIFSGLYLLTIFIASGIIFMCRYDYDYGLSYYLPQYNKRYKKVNIKNLERLFEEKKIIFERINHQELGMVDLSNNKKILLRK